MGKYQELVAPYLAGTHGVIDELRCFCIIFHVYFMIAFMRFWIRTGIYFVISLLVAGGLLSCSGRKSAQASSANGKTGKASRTNPQEGAIRVDLNVYTPGTIPQGIGKPVHKAQDLADAWMKAHPGRHIIFQQQINTGSSEGEWLKTQLIGGIAPEIINANAEATWPDVDKGWFIPLDEFLEKPNPYVPGNKHWIDLFSNQALLNAKRAPDGKLYCISVDIVETGLFYNKDLLRSVGVTSFPKTWKAMLEMFDKLKKKRLIPMTAPANLGSDWGQDILFEMVYHDILPEMDLLPSRADAQGYLGHYLEPAEAGFLFTRGFFTRRDPRWREMNRLLRQWRDSWAKELKNTDPDRLFLTQRMAVYWTGSWFIRRMATDPYIDFDWGVAYLPPLTRATCRYATGSPATVIGGAALQLHVTNSARINHNLDDCIDFLMYLTAPRNFEQLASEALVFIPNIRGAHMDERLAPFQNIFKRHYCAIKWLDSLDGKNKKYWRRMLDYYLNDGVDLDGYLAMLENNFSDWVNRHRKDKGWDFSRMEKVWKQRESVLTQYLDPVPQGK